jgi:hypothetical protein
VRKLCKYAVTRDAGGIREALRASGPTVSGLCEATYDSFQADAGSVVGLPLPSHSSTLETTPYTPRARCSARGSRPTVSHFTLFAYLARISRLWGADERTRTAELISLRVGCYGGELWKPRPSPFNGVGGGPGVRRGPGYRELTEAWEQPSSAFRVLPVLVAEAFDQLLLLFWQAPQ